MRLEDRSLRLRPVREDDCRLLWEWANDPEARAVSFSSEPIAWEQHVEWFESKLKDPRCIFYIAMNSDGLPIGQVRYDLDGNEAVISISIDQRFRGKGYGSTIIWLASQKLFEVSDVTVIHAYVRQSNPASARAFVKAGFRNMGMRRIREHQAIHLVLQKDELV